MMISLRIKLSFTFKSLIAVESSNSSILADMYFIDLLVCGITTCSKALTLLLDLCNSKDNSLQALTHSANLSICLKTENKSFKYNINPYTLELTPPEKPYTTIHHI